jgi:hypothetical protein
LKSRSAFNKHRFVLLVFAVVEDSPSKDDVPPLEKPSPMKFKPKQAAKSPAIPKAGDEDSEMMDVRPKSRAERKAQEQAEAAEQPEAEQGENGDSEKENDSAVKKPARTEQPEVVDVEAEFEDVRPKPSTEKPAASKMNTGGSNSGLCVVSPIV